MLLKLENLPVEIITRIFTLLDLDSLLNIGVTCRHLRACYNQDIIWKQLCSEYKYWGSNSTIDYVTYQGRYITRFQTDQIVDSLVHYCIQGADMHFNADQFELVHNDIGEDAKDRLFYHLNTMDDALDVLARRWWANELLLFLIRVEAMKDLFRILYDAEPFTEEKALTAFDMLIRRDCIVDQKSVSVALDCMAEEFKANHPRYSERSTRDLALKIAEFMTVNKNFHAPSSQYDYYEPANSLISYCLADPNHAGLQITHASIYCAVTRRLGLNARVIGTPESVMAIVYSPQGKSLEGNDLPESSDQEKIYVDPFRDDNWERSEADINRLISLVDRIPDYQGPNKQEMLEPMKPANFIIRVGNNLINCLQIRENWSRHSPLSEPIHGLHDIAIFYAVALVGLALKTTADRRTLDDVYANPMFRERRAYFPERMLNDHPWDEMLLYKTWRNDGTPFLDPHLKLHALPYSPLNSLSLQSGPKLRSGFRDRVIQFKVGTVFNHRRYRYTGMIVGWDESCAQDLFWQAAQRVDHLPGGAEQPFYSAMSVVLSATLTCTNPCRSDQDGHSRYVAEENIIPQQDPPFYDTMYVLT
jgi:F-box protein 21